ncbi:nitroreductase family protein [Methanothermobacter sp. DP]|uniref:nitroreductase family protein n=1 Tax=Methanothermobacter sp. DP TaxID=2998972 RepID=UPI002AA5B8B6|nr:nitroreductase family protein [Methanothermobacter sp. DP]
MEVLEAIKTRRSIRKYSKRDVPDEMLHKILEAAMCGPSAVDQRPWHFIVVKNRDMLEKIPEVHPYGAMVKDAPVAIIVCCDTSLEKFPGFWVQDCSIASQNILLAAHSLGLGAVWTGVYPLEDRVEGIRRLFQIPDHVIPFSVIPIGYPAEDPGTRDLFDPERIHIEKW